MAAKTGPNYQMSHTHRDKIKNSNILNALIEHAVGEREMAATQVSAGLGLLRKIMPDMQAQTFTDTQGNDLPAKITMEFVRANEPNTSPGGI